MKRSRSGNNLHYGVKSSFRGVEIPAHVGLLDLGGEFLDVSGERQIVSESVRRGAIGARLLQLPFHGRHVRHHLRAEERAYVLFFSIRGSGIEKKKTPRREPDLET